MEWDDQGILLKIKPYGDSSFIVTLFTEFHGKHSGIIRMSRKKSGHALLPGTLVNAHWQARLSEHLGFYRLETLDVPAASYLYDALRFAMLTSTAALMEEAFPEHDPHPEMYQAYHFFLKEMAQTDCLAAYVQFELTLLNRLGFGLDLSSCAATGETENLTFISPKSGRAVSYDAGLPYESKLLKFPTVFKEPSKPASLVDVLEGLEITGYFLEHHVFRIHQKRLPQARLNFIHQLKKPPLTPLTIPQKKVMV